MRILPFLGLGLIGWSQSAPSTLFRRDFSSPVDTLEINVLRVQFKQESPDNSKTTGNGHFDSDADTAGAHYSLDPQGKRGSQAYWQAQIQHASDYFSKASRGKLVIKARIFPEGDSAYTLPKSIIDYNRTAPKKGEKLAAYDSSRAGLYASFLRDAIRHVDSTGNSPFTLASGQHTQRVYLVAHAGASRLLDGGGLGTQGANTPGDFLDFYADTSYFRYLRSIPGAAGDSLGIVLNRPGVDTLRQVMSISETSSQDKINWGISGMLFHQIGRVIGLPVTYDGSSGISRLGQFDLMDFAGANSGNGFFPVLPSAWLRAYMGWEEVVTATPGPDGSFSTQIFAASDSTAGKTRLLKIPLSKDEYLLLENRQRSNFPNQKIVVSNDQGQRIELPADSLQLFFRDSLCPENKCTPNPNKGKGVVLGLSHPDAALPGVGIAVWRINESMIREYLQYGAVNLYPSAQIGDRFPGISLIEADGLNTMGKALVGRGNGTSYDFGSGAKLFPHLRWRNASQVDTVASLEPSGYASTISALAAQSGIKLKFTWPDASAQVRSSNPINGDSILNPAAQALGVQVFWKSSDSLPSLIFRKQIPGAAQAQSLLLSDLAWHALSRSGIAMSYNFQGKGALASTDSFKVNLAYAKTYEPLRDPSLSDSITLAIPSYDRWNTPLMGSVAKDSTLWILSQNELRQYRQLQTSDSTAPAQAIQALGQWPTQAQAGPVYAESSLWWASKDSLYQWKDGKIIAKSLPADLQVQSMAYGQKGLYLIGAGAKTLRVQDSKVDTLNPWPQAKISDLHQQFYRAAVSDFNGDGKEDLAIVGSHGTLAILDEQGQFLPGSPKRYARGQKISGIPSADLSLADSSALAVGDVDGDGFNDLIFSGRNSVFAVNASGATLNGFPWIPNRGPEEGYLNAYDSRGNLGSSPLIAQIKGQKAILIASASGLVYAINAKAQTLQGWPLLLGSPRISDSTSSPYWQIATQDRGGRTQLIAYGPEEALGYDLGLGSQSLWSATGASSARTFYTAAAPAPTPSLEAKIHVFAIYPNPVLGRRANLLLDLGAPATQSRLRLFSSANSEVYNQELGPQPQGRSQIQSLELPDLGSDVYAALLHVEFGDGKQVDKWFRIAVVR